MKGISDREIKDCRCCLICRMQVEKGGILGFTRLVHIICAKEYNLFVCALTGSYRGLIFR